MVALGLIASSVAISIVAYLITLQKKHTKPSKSHSQSPELQKAPIQTLYIIGDLHGDVECAKHWVQKTNLIPNLLTSPSSEWVWNHRGTATSTESSTTSSTSSSSNTNNEEESSLLFLGDYIDKGPNSRPTLEFVKSLTERFPHQVTAILGNHELELLKDRDGRYKTWGTGGYFQLPYATVHPAEYLHYFNSTDASASASVSACASSTTTTIEQQFQEKYPDENIDEVVIDALYNASLEVYSSNLYQSVMFTPTGSNSIVHFIQPPSLQKLVSERLAFYQQYYLDAFRTGTELGTWLETRPIMHLSKDGTLFVHGGINANVAQYLMQDKGTQQNDMDDIEDEITEDNSGAVAYNVNQLNELFHMYSNEKTLLQFLFTTKEGRLIEEMVVHRGNHKPNACHELQSFFQRMEGVKRLGVGHTPDETVRIQCDGTFLALDSLLGRWIREIGNDYCRGDKFQRSRDGRHYCVKIKDHCEGQITRIRDGNIEVIS